MRPRNFAPQTKTTAMQTGAPTKPMAFDTKDIDKATLLKLYEDLLRPRMIEEKMLILLRQGGSVSGSPASARKPLA
jgi:TPP-dependent pyruvate/acetoin dehydrogenase alpha subunit